MSLFSRKPAPPPVAPPPPPRGVARFFYESDRFTEVVILNEDAFDSLERAVNTALSMGAKWFSQPFERRLVSVHLELIHTIDFEWPPEWARKVPLPVTRGAPSTTPKDATP